MKLVEWIMVSILACILLLTAWTVFTDIKALKVDIKALRTYVMALPAPGQCGPPGMHVSSTFCSYQLEITGVIDKEKGLYKGKIDPKVYEASYTQCQKIKGTLREGFKDLPFECRTPDKFPNKDIVYAFYVDNIKEGLKEKEVETFESVPYTTHLIKKSK